MRTKLFTCALIGIIAPLFLSILCFSAHASNPGIVFKVETTYHSDSESGVETAEMSVQGHLLKMVILSDLKNEAIFRGDRQEMVVIDHDQKSYLVINEEMVEAMSHQLGEVKKMTQNLQIPEEALKLMPEAERKRIEAMMKQQLGVGPGGTDGTQRPKREYRKTGELGTKEGYPCLKYEVLVNGETIQELWVTGWDNVEGGDEIKGAFQEITAFFKEMMGAIGEMPGGGKDAAFFGGGNDPFSGFMEIDGIPIVTREFDGGNLERETILKSATRRDFDPSVFEPPSGYKRMKRTSLGQKARGEVKHLKRILYVLTNAAFVWNGQHEHHAAVVTRGRRSEMPFYTKTTDVYTQTTDDTWRLWVNNLVQMAADFSVQAKTIWHVILSRRPPGTHGHFVQQEIEQLEQAIDVTRAIAEGLKRG